MAIFVSSRGVSFSAADPVSAKIAITIIMRASDLIMFKLIPYLLAIVMRMLFSGHRKQIQNPSWKTANIIQKLQESFQEKSRNCPRPTSETFEKYGEVFVKKNMSILLAKSHLQQKICLVPVNHGAKIRIQFFSLRLERSSLYNPVLCGQWQPYVEYHMTKKAKKIIVKENSFEWDSGFSDG